MKQKRCERCGRYHKSDKAREQCRLLYENEDLILSMFETHTDAAIAKKLGLNVNRIRSYRNLNGLAKRDRYNYMGDLDASEFDARKAKIDSLIANKKTVRWNNKKKDYEVADFIQESLRATRYHEKDEAIMNV